MKKADRKSNMPPTNLILLGDPAAGKATHAAHLCRKFNMVDLDMGRELRQRKSQNRLLSDKLKSTYSQGKLTPTEIVREILREKIMGTPAQQGILFDGTPKMLGEAKLVAKWLGQQRRLDPLVIYLGIPIKETVRRMTERRDDFAGKFGKRDDDNPKALQNRVKYYRKNIKQVVAYFRRRYRFRRLSSNAPVPQVRKILNRLILEHRRIQSGLAAKKNAKK